MPRDIALTCIKPMLPAAPQPPENTKAAGFPAAFRTIVIAWDQP
jgi:hypothetical protein